MVRVEATGASRRAAARGEAGSFGAWRVIVRRVSTLGFRPGAWKRGRVLAASALVLGLIMALHARITDRWGLGSLVETFLPWFGLFVPVLLAGALWRRSASAMVALLLPTVVWLSLFGGLLGGLLGDRSGRR